jgi:hypothetical protein
MDTTPETPKPKRGKPHPKTDLEEPARAEVAAALKRVGRGPCSVSAELFRHTGMSNWLKTGKGLGPENVQKALEWARNVPTVITFDKPLPDPDKPRRQVLSHFANGEAVYEWTTEPEAPAFDPQPYQETTTPAKPSRRTQEEIDREASELRYLGRSPHETEPAPEPAPDPAAFVLETWAASKLTYAMETLGMIMPEGYRFRVTVEKS